MSFDQEIEDLRRQALANPDDRALQKRYDMALRRSGQSLPLFERYKFRYECPLKWDDLEYLDTPHLDTPESLPLPESPKFCRQCNKSVYLVKTPQEFEKHARQGDCVAAFDAVFKSYVEGTSGEEQTGPPCVVELPANLVSSHRVEEIRMGKPAPPEEPKPWWSKLWPFS